MKLNNSFTVPVGVDDAWAVLLDVPRIAPCLPGAVIDSVEGEEFHGRVKVKLGPIGLTYVGSARFVERDPEQHTVVIEGRGRDQRGNGTAAALITARLHGDGDNTRVDVVTDLDITGKPAQFGRGVMADVSAKLIGQFAERLSRQIQESRADPAAAAPAQSSTPRAAPRAPAAQSSGASDSAVPSVDEEALDLLALARGAVGRDVVAKVGVAAALIGLLLLVVRIARRTPAVGSGPGVTVVFVGSPVPTSSPERAG